MTEQELQPILTEAGLFSVVEELERSVESLAASLEQVRSAVRQVAAHIQNLEPAGNTTPSLSVVQTVPDPEVEAEPETNEPSLGSFSWSPSTASEELELASADEPDKTVAADSAEFEAAASEATREEVRKAVEATRAQLSWSNLRVDSGFTPGTSQSEVKAPDETAVHDVLEPAAELEVPYSEPVNAEEDPEAARREEVRLAVERARADMTAAEAQPVEPAANSEEERREEVRLAVERARADMMAAEASQAEPELDPEEARREEVRLAVERARAEMFAAETPAAEDDEARREEVRRVVESARGAGDWSTMRSDAGSWGQFKPEPGGFTIGPDQAPPRPIEPIREADSGGVPMSDEEARREEVRRTVEAARAEMMDDSEPLADRPHIVPIMPKPGQPVAKGSDFNGPPTIVIEDSLGRVELSQVFATLSKVDRSAQAALLNYTPHSVTIGLSMLSSVPDANELALAAQSVFGRVCTVKSEGSRTAIEIGTHLVGS